MVLGVILVSFGDLGDTFSDFEGIGNRLEIWTFLRDSLQEPKSWHSSKLRVKVFIQGGSK